MYKRPTSGSGKKSNNLSQYGLLDIPDLDDEDLGNMSDDDIDLEAELAAIGGGGGGRKPRQKKPAQVPAANLDAMIADSLRDVPSDEDIGSGDEDDPELLSELKELGLDEDEAPPPPPRSSRPAPPPPGSAGSTTVSLLRDRINNYTLAEKTAKENGESSRARRFSRGLKTLNDLMKQANAGKSIKEEDIPPPVSIGKSSTAQSTVSETPPCAPEPAAQPEPTVSEPEEPPSLPEPSSPPPPLPSEQELDPEKQKGMQVILKRKQEFKAAALSASHAGDKALAFEYLKVLKQFDLVVDAYKSGQEMDLNELPTTETIAVAFKSQQKSEEHMQNAAEERPPSVDTGGSGLITASTVDEALRQRLAAFQEQEAKAKSDGNSSKARRLGRVVKQYQDAIKLNSAGKPISVDELPTPLGYGPIPVQQPSRPAPAPGPAPSPSPSPRPATRPGQATRYDKQIAFLLQRQKLFKEAAIKAKKEGNVEQAKEYLRAAKGFDSVIDAAKGGLLVDLKSLPLPPKEKDQLEHTFDVVSAEDCTPSRPAADTDGAAAAAVSADGDVLAHLQQQLASQLKLCHTNRDHYRAMGNVAETNRFEHLAVSVKQDLDVVTVAKRLGNDPPKFHYESRQFSVVQCNTDLNENDLELTIVRGIAFNVPNPKDIDTYVKFEFPYPQEAPVSDRTSLIKDTNSPEFNAVFPLAINRSARPCQRLFKRHGIKFEVYSRGQQSDVGACCARAADTLLCCSGWFSRDPLLGTVTVKLDQLQSQVTLHEAYPLMDGRRPAGGSLEVKLRVRTPILMQQFVNTTHRWLVIDN